MITSFDLISCSCRGRLKVISALLRLTTFFNSLYMAPTVQCGICSGDYVTLEPLDKTLLISDLLSYVTCALEVHTDINISIKITVNREIFNSNKFSRLAESTKS